MKFNKDDFIELMENIIAISDIMYQSIKVDAFEVFESTLDERMSYLEQYQFSYNEFDHTLRTEIDQFLIKMNEYEVLIRNELERYDQKMHSEFVENRKQLTQLLEGQKKTQQYTGSYDRNINGSIFDRKK